MTFSFGSAKVCSPAILEIFFSYDKDILIAATVYLCTFTYYAISINTYSSADKFYSVTIFNLLIDAVILLLNCLVLIVYLCIYFLSLRHYFLYSNIILTFTYLTLHHKSLYCLITSTSYGVENYFPRLRGMGDDICFHFLRVSQELHEIFNFNLAWL